MKKEPIIFEWIENGDRKKRDVNRYELLNLMQSIKLAFIDDNEISTILVEIIPNINYILINKDRNEQKDIPSIYCKSEKGEKMIDIRRYHKIIWAILNRYTQE